MDGNLTSGYVNLSWVNVIDGAPLTSTTPTNIEPATSTNPGPAFQSWWLNQGYAPARTVHFLARGVVSTAASAPGTLTMAVALGNTPTVMQATPAFTPAVSLNNGLWEMEGDLTWRSGGSAGLVQCSGQLAIANGAAVTTDMVSYAFPQNTAAASWETAFDNTMAGTYAPIPFHIRATWSTAPAGDSIACLALKLWADN